jgi:hypothetical protein
LLQRLYTRADRRLGDVQLPGSAAKATLAHDSVKCKQLIDIHVLPIQKIDMKD